MNPHNCDRVMIIKKGESFEYGTHFSRTRKLLNPLPISHWGRQREDNYKEEYSETEWADDWWCTHGDWYAKIVGNRLTVIAYPKNSFHFEEAFYYQVKHYHETCDHLPSDINHLEYYYNSMKKRRYLVI